jgi:hypothetical protein
LISGGGEIFHTRPDRLWDSHSFLQNGKRISLQGVRLPGYGVDHPPTSSTKVKERAELLLYFYFMAYSRVKFTFYGYKTLRNYVHHKLMIRETNREGLEQKLL